MKSKSEEFCKECLDRYLRKTTNFPSITWIDIEQNEEPPDYYLFLGGVKYAVEITRLFREEIVSSKYGLPARVVSEYFRKFISDDIENIARTNGFLQGTYLITITKPITNFSAKKEQIQNNILIFINTSRTAQYIAPQIIYKYKKEMVQIEKLSILEDKVISGGPVLSSFEGDAILELTTLIYDRIEKKKQKLSNISAPKILILHNEYSFDFIVENLREMILPTPSFFTFCKIFLVYHAGKIEVIYSQ